MHSAQKWHPSELLLSERYMIGLTRRGRKRIIPTDLESSPEPGINIITLNAMQVISLQQQDSTKMNTNIYDEPQLGQRDRQAGVSPTQHY